MKRFAPTTGTLLGLNLAVYPLESEKVCEAYGLIPAHFSATGDVRPFFTHLFLHDPSSSGHLVFNMIFLIVFGTIVEKALGSLRFLGLYLVCGVFGGLLHVFVDPASIIPLVGASGALFGLLAVATAIDRRLFIGTALFVGFNVYDALTGSSVGPSFGAHLGGFATGVFAAILMHSNNTLETES